MRNSVQVLHSQADNEDYARIRSNPWNNDLEFVDINDQRVALMAACIRGEHEKQPGCRQALEARGYKTDFAIWRPDGTLEEWL